MVPIYGHSQENDGIEKRLNTQHEHFKEFKDGNEVRIWIGSLANPKHQKYKNIDLIETLFIRAYSAMLTENKGKKQKEIDSSIALSICGLIKMKRCRHIELKDPALMMLSFTITRKIGITHSHQM